MTSKKALLIGINYRGTNAELRGCINDVESMKGYLLQHGYSKSDLTILTDDTPVKPTRANMIVAMLNLLMSGAEHLFIHYSGHGSWERDLNGDESDGRDETLVPLDYQEAGMLTDDQLRGLLTFVSPRSRLTVILDCCHSGTGMDLAYCLKESSKMVRIKQGDRWIRKRVPDFKMVRDIRYNSTSASVVMLSGCLDRQTSADAYEEKKFQGAMTFCLLKALEQKADWKWGELIVQVRELLRTHQYEQIANLTSGQAIDLNDNVVFC